MSTLEDAKKARAVAEVVERERSALLSAFADPQTSDEWARRWLDALALSLREGAAMPSVPQLAQSASQRLLGARPAGHLRALSRLRRAIGECCARYDFGPNDTAVRRVEVELDRAMIEAAEYAEASAAEIAAIIQSIPDAIYVGDAHGIRYCNRTALARFGLESEQQLEHPIEELHALLDVRAFATGEPLSRESSGFMRALEGMSSTEEIVARNPQNGRSLVLRASYSPVLHDGSVIGAVSVQTDITEQKRVEERRERLHELEQQARRDAENANRIKDDFIATVSHELRTPLSAILGWARLLADGHLSADKHRDAIRIVERNAKAQAQLIEDLLDVARISSGKLRLEMQMLDPLEVVEAALDVVRATADVKGVALTTHLETGTGPLVADPERLRQIVWNLLTNAVKFTSKGGGVQVRLTRNDAHVELVVQDEGRGIAHEFLPFVFDKFRQAETTASKSQRGLGLGLSIAKYLVEAHGGTIHAESEGLERGATFRVLLPVAHAEPDLVTRDVTSVAESVEEPLSLVGYHVLVVDDEADACGLVATLLEPSRPRVSIAYDVPSALAMFDALRPDLVISDIGMPGATGYDLIRSIRQRPTNKGGAVPAVALTAYARSEDRTRALAAGFDMHVPKPVEPAELMAVIGSLVARRTL